MGLPDDRGLIDVHLHLQDPRLSGDLDRIIADLRRERIRFWGVNATHPNDWDEVARLADSHREVVPFFGVHPWKIENLEPGWEAGLERLLQRFPHAGVGEIGLDRWIRDHRISLQRGVLASQLEIARRWSRPVSIHCLQAWGHLEEILDATGFKSPFLLHSFSGPVEMLPRMLPRGAYFSISGYFFRPVMTAKLDVFREIPKERILLESDAPDMAPPDFLRPYRLGSEVEREEPNHPANLRAIYQAYAEFAGQPFEEVLEQIQLNHERWLADSFRTGSEAPDRS